MCLLGLLQSGDVNVLMGVPTMYSKLLAHYDTSMDDDARAHAQKAAGALRLAVCGSSACPVPVMQRWVHQRRVTLPCQQQPGSTAASELQEVQDTCLNVTLRKPSPSNCATHSTQSPVITVGTPLTASLYGACTKICAQVQLPARDACCWSGHAPCCLLACRWHEVSGQMLLERYGMTETGMVLSNPYVVRLNSAWQVFGTTIRVAHWVVHLGQQPSSMLMVYAFWR